MLILKRSPIILALLILVSVLLTGCRPVSQTIVGEWISSDGIAEVFNEDGTFEELYYIPHYPPSTPIDPGKPSDNIPLPISDGGKWQLRYQGTYTIDYSKNPAWIDIVTTDGGLRPQQGLIKFLNNNTIIMAVDDVRPASINTSRRQARLTRAAPNEISR